MARHGDGDQEHKHGIGDEDDDFFEPHHLNITNIFDIDPSLANKHPGILCLVIFTSIVHIAVLAYCYYLDKKDRKQELGITIMADAKRHEGFYLVTIVTGCRCGAGTTSKVSLRLYGTEGRSSVYVLRDNISHVLNRGSIDTFFVSSVKNLGHIEKIRMWHDNTGTSPNWYCRKVLIRDVLSEDEWCFIVHKWLHVHNNESSIIFEQDSSLDTNFRRISRRFLENFFDQFDTSHLWFSIFRYTASSSFTRCQRIICEFAILTWFMLLNMMYHEKRKSGIMKYVVSFQVTLMAAPIGVVLSLMFRRITARYVTTLIVWRDREQMKINASTISVGPSTADTTVLHEITGTSNFSPSTNTITTPESESIIRPSTTSFVMRMEELDDPQPLSKDPSLNLLESMVDGFMFPTFHFLRGPREREKARTRAEIKYRRERRSGQAFTEEEEILEAGGSFFEDFGNKIPGIAFETCEMEPHREEYLYLPWWFIYISWPLCIILIVANFYFIYLYGVEHGPDRTVQWFYGMMGSVTISIFIMQPIKIGLLALLFTGICPAKQWSVADEDRFQILVRDVNDDNNSFHKMRKRSDKRFRRKPSEYIEYRASIAVA